MYQTLNTISAVLFMLSGILAAAAVYMFFHFDIREYRILVSNDAENRARTRKKQAGERSGGGHTAVSGDGDGGNRMEKPRKTTVTNPVQKTEKSGETEGKKRPRFVMRTVSESDALRRENGEDRQTAAVHPEPDMAQDAEPLIVPENDAEKKDRAVPAGEGRTAYHAAHEEPDGVTGLQDGSGDTVYLKDSDRKKLSVFEDDDPLWLPPAGRFRTTGSSMIIHTDRTISQILSEKGREGNEED